MKFTSVTQTWTHNVIFTSTAEQQTELIDLISISDRIWTHCRPTTFCQFFSFLVYCSDFVSFCCDILLSILCLICVVLWLQTLQFCLKMSVFFTVNWCNQCLISEVWLSVLKQTRLDFRLLTLAPSQKQNDSGSVC